MACGLIDIKAENVMLNYYFKTALEVDITKVRLIDSEGVYLVKDGKYAFDLKIGHPFWRSLEALVGCVIGKPTDIFLFRILVRSIDYLLIAHQLMAVLVRLSSSF